MADSKIILVTGATAGFGKAIAETFAAKGWDVIITGRRQERLKELAQKLTGGYGVRVLPLHFDVRDKVAVNEQLGQLPDNWREIDVLVNNAGLALGRDLFDQASMDDWEAMIDTNIKGLLYVSRAVLPYFEKRGEGHIINIGSTAAKDVYPMGNVYCATKSAVEAISKAQRIDLLSKKIKVTAIHPGAAATEFSLVRFKGDQAESDKVYKGYQALEATDIADITYYVATLPKHVCINDLVVTCTAQANAFFTHKEG
ncbi:NADP-dependent 3-hydroxy acid dehydrogenase YdfG [Arachidicoccus rhizosphaerae]|jgi:NADP-dependent 3-hydroxy acid dehydrogenase YdfG|uniref:NADP-dependent 3-hydroxy acid dehydrogenase YdfG n=1 Tax=Arachidicoccus rhizosphaerae TaxID=551991 RepID=A0A1H3YGM6_9BACT|nr:SDR family NAD(P)-dependent oxidoreductase [Arachidicoccus rhizosphaerae]SEA10713.1 NADP-dependent 3-hydroxy acid dehydrogenase YdfG [Arachidicoccus rhizosphaerae]